MTGVCCRCQVRHDDELCCRHGVICNGDAPAPDEQLARLYAENGDMRRSFEAFGLEPPPPLNESGMAEQVVVVLGAVGIAAAMGVATWLGYNASDAVKVIVGVVIVLAALPVVAYALRADVDDDQRAPLGTARYTDRPRHVTHEPKEHS